MMEYNEKSCKNEEYFKNQNPAPKRCLKHSIWADYLCQKPFITDDTSNNHQHTDNIIPKVLEHVPSSIVILSEGFHSTYHTTGYFAQHHELQTLPKVMFKNQYPRF